MTKRARRSGRANGTVDSSKPKPNQRANFDKAYRVQIHGETEITGAHNVFV